MPYQNGLLEAIAFDRSGKEIGRDALETAGFKTILTAEPEKPSAAPDRLAFIRIRYTNDCGTTKPVARGMLSASVSGGTLEAFGSACPFYEQSYLDPVSDTYYGEALAVVRAGSGAELVFSVTDGTASASVRIPVIPAES